MNPSTQTAAQAAALTAAAADAATLAVATAAGVAVNAAINAADITATVGNGISNTPPILGSTSQLMTNVTNFQYNPAMIQASIMQTLTDVTNGSITIVDPTNPFVFALEAASSLTAAFMIKNEANTRKQYPFAAQTPEDLYLHMSDVDYINRFATPSSTTFCLLFPLNEVLNKMVLNPATGIKQIVIPRNTYFTVANTSFSIQYPVMIQQLQHGGLQVVYDATVTSPLEALTTNIIQYEIRQNLDAQYIYFELPTTQFDIISQTGTLDSATDFSLDINFTQQYYYTRVYVENPNGTWTEIRTTHTDEIYDINVPTAVLKVVNNTTNTIGTSSVTLGGVVTVSIPQIYTGTGVLNSGIRIDLYETQGPLDMILWEYPMPSFTARWLAIDSNDDTEYTAPLSTFSSIIPFSTYVVSGGSNATPFPTLRNQVITNAIGMPSLPITNAQIQTVLNIDGYTIVKNVDNITNRVFLATKTLPVPTDTSLITPAAATVMTLNTTIDQLVQINTVIDNSSIANGLSVTITPDTVYQAVNGVLLPLSNNQLSSLFAMNKATMALTVTNGNYLYTPFHYVLDMTKNEFNVRPYYLDNPSIITQLFVLTNTTTVLQVNTGTYSIYRTATGYTVTVVTLSNSLYQALPDTNVQAQLSFLPHGESTPAYILGTLMAVTPGGERIFSFDLSTNFNVDSNECIQLTKFLMFANQPRLTGAALTTNFDIIYTTTSNVGAQWVADSIDTKLSDFLLPTNAIGITQEILRVKFGDSLTRLWARARSVVSSNTYQKWATDIPRVYERDIYATDANGSVVQFDAEGGPVLNLLHKAGDTVFNNAGLPVLLHNAGDVVLDSFGNPVQTSGRGMMRQIDMMLIDGAYWFATNSVAAAYRTNMTQSMLKWITSDLVNIETQLLEQTNIYFYPNATLGAIRAMVDNGTIVKINASQSFNIVLSVSQVVYDDNALRAQLSTSTISTISQQLMNSTFSLDTITTALRGVYGKDVVSMQLTGLGGIFNYSVVTVMNTSENCSIKKKLVANPDGTLSVLEDVSITFNLYQVPVV